MQGVGFRQVMNVRVFLSGISVKPDVVGFDLPVKMQNAEKL